MHVNGIASPSMWLHASTHACAARCCQTGTREGGRRRQAQHAALPHSHLHKHTTGCMFHIEPPADMLMRQGAGPKYAY